MNILGERNRGIWESVGLFVWIREYGGRGTPNAILGGGGWWGYRWKLYIWGWYQV